MARSVVARIEVITASNVRKWPASFTRTPEMIVAFARTGTALGLGRSDTTGCGRLCSNHENKC